MATLRDKLNEIITNKDFALITLTHELRLISAGIPELENQDLKEKFEK